MTEEPSEDPPSPVHRSGWRRFLHDNALSLVLVALFLVFWLVGQALSGWRVFKAAQQEQGEPLYSLPRYLTTSHFGEATFENWESEFLQMAMYVLLTVKLVQRGSSESRPLDQPFPQDEDPAGHRDDPSAPWPVRRGGTWLLLYRNSLSLAFGLCFVASFLLHAWTGSRAFNHEQASSGVHVTMWSYFGRAQFWFESWQNWQSEFLAVAAIVLLSVVLRQYGSPESKPVHAPHRESGE